MRYANRAQWEFEIQLLLQRFQRRGVIEKKLLSVGVAKSAVRQIADTAPSLALIGERKAADYIAF